MKHRNSTYNTTENVYKSIEFLPIWNWIEILKTGDLKHLFLESNRFEELLDKQLILDFEVKKLKRKSKLKPVEYVELKLKESSLFRNKRIIGSIPDLWDSLQDENINVFGLDEDFKKQLKLLKQKAKLNYEFVVTGEMFIETKLDMIEADLNSLNNKKVIDFYELKSHLEKFKGCRIDPKVTTVMEWNYDLKTMSNG